MMHGQTQIKFKKYLLIPSLSNEESQDNLLLVLLIEL
jgi:hypothetical protein